MPVYSKQYYQDHKEEYNKSRKKYRQSSIKRIPLDVQNDWYTVLKEYCDVNDIKVNSFIKSACEQVALQNGFEGFVEYYKKEAEPEGSQECLQATTQNNVQSNIPDNAQIPAPALLYLQDE